MAESEEKELLLNDPDTSMMSTDTTISIQRQAIDSKTLNVEFEYVPEETTPLKERAVNTIKNCPCAPSKCPQSFLGLFPFIDLIRTYKVKEYLVGDIVAGLSVGIIHIPQSMGFALLTSVPPVYGLYSSFFPVLIYFFFGTSRHISVGTMAVISLMIGSVVDRNADNFVPSSSASDPASNLTWNNSLLNGTDPQAGGSSDVDELTAFKVDIALSMSLLMGIIQLVMGVFRLGIVTNIMCLPFISGFTTGAVFHITTSQVKFIFGMNLPRIDGMFKLPITYFEVLKNIGSTNVAVLVTSIICFAILIVIKEIINVKYKQKLPIQIPAELIVVVLGTVISYFAKLNENFNVKIVGEIPRGIPTPRVPSFYNASDYVVDSILAAVVGFTISISMARIFTRKYNYNVDTNQELIAYGLSNGVSSLLHCFGGAVAPPRCMVHDSAGGKTQVASLFSSALVLLVLLVMGPLFQTLPNAVLAAVIVVALFPLFKQFMDLKTFWRTNRWDFATWLVTWGAVTFLDVTIGLAIGIVFSMLTAICQSHQAKGYILANLHNTEIYGAAERYKNTDLLKHTMIFKFDSPLYFANVEKFKQQLYEGTVNPGATKSATKKEDEMATVNGENSVAKDTGLMYEPPKNIVIDCSAIGFVDVMGINTISLAAADYKKINIDVSLACCVPVVQAKLRNAQVPATFYPTVNDAVVAAGGSKRESSKDENKNDEITLL